ncbi:MAG TPA: hypothetical protein VL092_04840, partial [Chitinophagaceae bacterium]|nr:hypothetical protein [Chitinophagaceae bacterium]
MRKILAFTLLCGLALQGNAQPAKKDITLEDIWKNGTFRVKSVPGFNAMEDGKRYTQLDNENGKQSISTYNLASGKKEKTLFDNALHTDGGTKLNVADYSFSKNEQKM